MGSARAKIEAITEVPRALVNKCSKEKYGGVWWNGYLMVYSAIIWRDVMCIKKQTFLYCMNRLDL